MKQVNDLVGNIKKCNFIGYASVYLDRFHQESKSNDEIDIDVFKELVELDTKLGVTTSQQLYEGLYHTSRLDIIEVGFKYSNKGFKIILDYRS